MEPIRLEGTCYLFASGLEAKIWTPLACGCCYLIASSLKQRYGRHWQAGGRYATATTTAYSSPLVGWIWHVGIFQEMAQTKLY